MKRFFKWLSTKFDPGNAAQLQGAFLCATCYGMIELYGYRGCAKAAILIGKEIGKEFDKWLKQRSATTAMPKLASAKPSAPNAEPNSRNLTK
jgi:hypothetical protein